MFSGKYGMPQCRLNRGFLLKLNTDARVKTKMKRKSSGGASGEKNKRAKPSISEEAKEKKLVVVLGLKIRCCLLTHCQTRPFWKQST